MKINNAWLKHSLASLLCLPFLMFIGTLQALTFTLPQNGDVVGEVKHGVARHGESVSEIARRYQVGYYEFVYANPHINTRHRMRAGTKVIIPTRYVLPPGPREGIVINLAELRLYYYPEDSNIVVTEPVGIGREGNWKTPLGETTVTSKVKDPVWRPTANVRAEAARNGTPIPAVFPPGPNNPLGRSTIRLGWPTYLIHGTNRPEGVGARVSAGCIRMLPEDISQIFSMVKVGTRVRVINEPFKAGWLGGRLYFEAHYPLSEQEHIYSNTMAPVVAAISEKTQGRNAYVQWSTVKQISRRPNGIPQVISN